MLLNRNQFLMAVASAGLAQLLPRGVAADRPARRWRPSDAAWPAPAAWKKLAQDVGGNLIPVDFPLSVLKTNPGAASQLSALLHNPYYVGDQPGLTQTLGWVDAWTSKPSVYAVAARNAHDIAAAVNFARTNNLRLAIKGGGHSYLGNSNAPDSLLIWTRHIHDIQMHPAFVPQGCTTRPQPAVTVSAGTIGMQAYDAVTTRGGKYVQGGGCLTVGLAGLTLGGGFGSYSKHYGTAAASLLEAEVITADGQIRIANACTNPDLFWALKGGGGSTFCVVSKLTLRLHDLPSWFGTANFTVKAASDAAYKRLILEFVRFYRSRLFNDHWGEQAHVGPENTLEIRMTSQGLSGDQAQAVWQPFLDFVKRSPQDFAITDRIVIGSIPARHWWDVAWWKEHWPEIAYPNPNGNPFIGFFDYALSHVLEQPAFRFDARPDAPPGNAWWTGDGDQVAQYLWGYESLWLPASLLADSAQAHLADALFASSRQQSVGLHFNKGLAGAPPDVIAAAKDTATNPAVLSAFALVIVADGQGPAYPGIAGHEPSVAEGRKSRARIARCTAPLRALVPHAGSYMSESNYFEPDWQHSYWGGNYPRLLAIKQKYDPEGLFFSHNGVGSEGWSRDGFTRA